MNNSSATEQAARELLSRRQNKSQGGRLAENLRPRNSDESLAIQAAVTELSGGEISGWKCLLPLGEDQLIVAPMLGAAIIGDTCPIISRNGKARYEPEFAFVLTADLPARSEDYRNQEIDEAIGHYHLALELVNGRFDPNAEPDFYEKLADCLTNEGVYLGPEISKEAAYQTVTVPITVKQNGQVSHHEGKHPNELPPTGIYWLINYMSKRGVTFHKGEAIITGSFAGVLEADLDSVCEITYEGLGTISVTFQEKV